MPQMNKDIAEFTYVDGYDYDIHGDIIDYPLGAEDVPEGFRYNGSRGYVDYGRYVPRTRDLNQLYVRGV